MKDSSIKEIFSFLALLLSLAVSASAEMSPSFDMSMMADQAHRIVVGNVDQNGLLIINLVLKGHKPDPTTEVKLDKVVAKQLRSAMGLTDNDPFKVAAFLDASNNPVWGAAGIVGLEDARVWMCQRSKKFRGRGSLRHTVNNTYTATSFVKKIGEALAVISKRKALTDLPSSTKRAVQIIDFLQGKDNYQLRQLVHALGSLDPKEENKFLAILKEGASSTKTCIILDIARVMPFRPKNYDNIAAFLDRKHLPLVRCKAIAALPQIDMGRVAATFGPFLALNESELHTFLTNLRASPSGSVRNFPDVRVLNPLLRLVSDLRKHHAKHGRNVLSNESFIVLDHIQSYAHPQFLPLIYEWAMNDDHVTSNQALSTLQSLTGLSYGRPQKDSWDKWWDASRAVLLADYDLKTEQGRTIWITALSRSDAATRGLLLRLWLFETAVPEKDLLVLASGTGQAKVEAAKLVLFELWQHKRLSPMCRKNLVVRFLNLSFAQHPSQFQRRHNLLIVTDSKFPFPKDSWVQQQCAWSLNSTAPMFGNIWGAFSLHDVKKILLSSWSGPTKDDSIVRVVVEIREVERGSRGKVLWSHQWTLGPTAVKKIPYVEQEKR